MTIRKSIFPVESEILNEAEEEELKKKFLSRRETRKSIFQVEQQIQKKPVSNVKTKYSNVVHIVKEWFGQIELPKTQRKMETIEKKLKKQEVEEKKATKKTPSPLPLPSPRAYLPPLSLLLSSR